MNIPVDGLCPGFVGHHTGRIEANKPGIWGKGGHVQHVPHRQLPGWWLINIEEGLNITPFGRG